MTNGQKRTRGLFVLALASVMLALFSFVTPNGRAISNQRYPIAPLYQVPKPATPTQKPPQSPSSPSQQQGRPTPSGTPSSTTQTPSRKTESAPSQSPPPSPQQQKQQAAPKKSSDEIEDDEVIRVASKLVMVPVSVINEKGEPVQGLKPEDFRLEEEGRAQEIAQVGDPEQVPLELALLLDISGSVNARFTFEQEAASRFLKAVLRPIDKAAIYSVGIEPRLEQERAGAEIAAQKVMAITPSKGPTAFFDTVVDATKYLARTSPPRHRRVIVVISDGEDNFSQKVKESIGATSQEQNAKTLDEKLKVFSKVLNEVQREVQQAEITFYSINPSGQSLRLNRISTRAQESMAKLAEATGGEAFVPEELEDLDKIFRQIAAELRSQYLLQYYSNNNAPPGKYLTIKVRLPTQPSLRVRARQGYYAQQPK